MTIIDVLIALLIIVGVGSLAFWIITKFLPPEYRTMALAITGVLLLIMIFIIFFPGIGGYRVWR